MIKTRLQIQGELSIDQNLFAADRKYKGSLRGTIHIIKTEGVGGLYKGIEAALLREAVYSTMRIGGYDLMKSVLMKNSPKGVITNILRTTFISERNRNKGTILEEIRGWFSLWLGWCCYC